MPTYRANVTTPWARAGEEFTVEEETGLHRHYLDNLVLTDVTPKKATKAKRAKGGRSRGTG